MPRKDDKIPIHILVSRDDHEKIKAHAGNLSDYIRGLIKQDMAEQGVEVDLGIEHGGARPRKEQP